MEQLSAAEQSAAKVAAKIEDSGVKIVWLCEKTGIPRATMRRRMSARSAFNLNELDAIAAALRIPVTDLLPGIDDLGQVS